jgi:hypothetical protein
MNKIDFRIMRKNSTTAKVTSVEKDRNKGLSKYRYIVEQYFGISHLNDGAQRARITTIEKKVSIAGCDKPHTILQKG